MKFSTFCAAVGVSFLAVGLLLIRASASYSAGTLDTTHAAAPGQVVIPAAALPPFDPAATRITESDGTLSVYLQSGNSRQDLHILPQRADRHPNAVRVFHANHGQLMSLRMDDSCRMLVGEFGHDSKADPAASMAAGSERSRCRRVAA